MNKTLLSLMLFAAFNANAAIQQRSLHQAPALSVAKHGADDAKGDDRGRHGPGHAKKGADDPKGDDRGRHGPGHAKNGADDPKGDDRGRHGPGHA